MTMIRVCMLLAYVVMDAWYGLLRLCLVFGVFLFIVFSSLLSVFSLSLCLSLFLLFSCIRATSTRVVLAPDA